MNTTTANVGIGITTSRSHYNHHHGSSVDNKAEEQLNDMSRSSMSSSTNNNTTNTHSHYLNNYKVYNKPQNIIYNLRDKKHLNIRVLKFDY